MSRFAVGQGVIGAVLKSHVVARPTRDDAAEGVNLRRVDIVLGERHLELARRRLNATNRASRRVRLQADRDAVVVERFLARIHDVLTSVVPALNYCCDDLVDLLQRAVGRELCGVVRLGVTYCNRDLRHDVFSSMMSCCSRNGTTGRLSVLTHYYINK